MRRWSLLVPGVRGSVLVLSALLGIVSGLGAYTFWYAEATSYFSNDPKVCTNCHVMRPYYDSWSKASHHAVAVCNDCHIPHDLAGKYLTKVENGFWHSKGFTLQDFREPIQITPRNSRVLQRNCVGCHSAMVGDIIGAERGGDGTNYCVRCHASVGHGPRR